MRRMRLLAGMTGILLLLTGCQAQSSPDTSVETAAGTESPTTVPEAYEIGDTLPVLSLQTKAGDSLDFVTEPVAEHVAKSIASWTPGYVIPPAPYYETCAVSLTLPDGTQALSAEADVKVRGNWTTTYAKKPLRVKFAEKQSLLGLHGGENFKNWLLLAEYKDGSLLRNYASLQISRGLLGKDGLYAADAQLVEVEINGQYWGVYLLTEQQQVNAHRVAVTAPEKDYQGTDIGYFLEFDGYYTNEDALHGFEVSYADNAPLTPFLGDEEPTREIRPIDAEHPVGMSIKSDIYSQAQHDFIANYVNKVYEVLYYAAYEDRALGFDADYAEISEQPDMTPQQAVEAVIDVDSLADMYIISELTVDADLYWSSFYMDADFGAEGDGRLRFEAPWDFDSGLGNKDRCADGKGFYAANGLMDVNDQYETINPWLTVLMQEDWFRDIIREKWTAAYDEGLFSQAATDIRELAAAHEAAFARNADRWDVYRNNEAASELCRRAKKCKNEAEAADYLAEWLETRTAFLNDYWHE